MKQPNSVTSVATSVTFLLGKLGAVAGTGFAAKLAPHGLTPRHCAVLELVSAEAMSQLDLARRIGVTPSVVGDMLDELEPLGAVRRTPDPSDRRRRILTLTAAGRRLHATAVAAAAAADDELLAGFAAADRAALIHQLRAVGAAHGFDYS